MAKIKITQKIGLDKDGRAVPFEHLSARILLAGIGKEIPEELAKKHGVRKDGTVPEPPDNDRPAVSVPKGRPTVTSPRPPKVDEKVIPPVTEGMKKPRLLAIAKRRGLENLEGYSQADLFEILAKYDEPGTVPDPDEELEGITLETELTTELTRAQLLRIARLRGLDSTPPAEISDAEILAVLQKEATRNEGSTEEQDENAAKGQGAEGVEGEARDAPDGAGE